MAQKLINLEEETIAHIKNNFEIKNFSNWVNQTYQKEFMSLEYYKCELKKTKSKIDVINLMIEREELKPKQTSKITKEAKDWLKREGINRIENTTLEGVHKFFCKEFLISLSMKEFLKLINEIK